MNQWRCSAEETAIAVSAEIATMSSKNAYEIARSEPDSQIMVDRVIISGEKRRFTYLASYYWRVFLLSNSSASHRARDLKQPKMVRNKRLPALDAVKQR